MLAPIEVCGLHRGPLVRVELAGLQQDARRGCRPCRRRAARWRGAAARPARPSCRPRARAARRAGPCARCARRSRRRATPPPRPADGRSRARPRPGRRCARARAARAARCRASRGAGRGARRTRSRRSRRTRRSAARRAAPPRRRSCPLSKATCAPARKPAPARTRHGSDRAEREPPARERGEHGEQDEQQQVDAARCGAQRQAVQRGPDRVRLDLGARHQLLAAHRRGVHVAKRRRRGAHDHDVVADSLGRHAAVVYVRERDGRDRPGRAAEVDPGLVVAEAARRRGRGR